MQKQLMIYGAYGYTGELMAREAVRRGLRPVIAGRSQSKLLSLATELNLEHRIFDVKEASNQLRDMAVILNCAGPFTATVNPLVEACLQNGTHYVDITGEIPVFQFCHQMDSLARKAGVILCPGAGFDIVPTDCLAALLKELLPDAEQINLAFSFGCRPSVGTATTAVESIEMGGMIRRNHRLQSVPNGYRMRRIPFQDGLQWTLTVPWGDVFTSGLSTGAPDGMVYTALPLPVSVVLRATDPLKGLLTGPRAQRLLKALVAKYLSGGPSDEARATQRSQFWGEAVAADGSKVTATMSAGNVYTLTVDAALGIAERCLTVSDRAGNLTPSMLMGSDYITTLPDVILTMPPETTPGLATSPAH